jgi:hypothetical protein
MALSKTPRDAGTVLTRSIDAALNSMNRARQDVPFLRDLYPEASVERTALVDVLSALAHADAVLMRRDAVAPIMRG